MSLTVRPYRPSDCPILAELFYQTVHGVCGRDLNNSEKPIYRLWL